MGDFGPVIEANTICNQVASRRPVWKRLEDPSRPDLNVVTQLLFSRNIRLKSYLPRVNLAILTTIIRSDLNSMTTSSGESVP